MKSNTWARTSCALNVPVDGSEDDAIHCFKEEQPRSTGLDMKFLFECFMNENKKNRQSLNKNRKRVLAHSR